MKVFAAAGVAMMGVSGRQIVAEAVHHRQFFLQARALGLTEEQAKSIIETEALHGAAYFTAGDLMTRAELRLASVAEIGYLTVTLGEVLDQDELHRQTFNASTVLNDPRWMERQHGQYFSEMSRSRQRTLVLAAIELTLQLGGDSAGWTLERAVAAVMPGRT